MTQEKVLSLICLLEKSNYNWAMDQSQAAIWAGELINEDERDLSRAIREVIRTSEFPPTLAVVIDYCRQAQEERVRAAEAQRIKNLPRIEYPKPIPENLEPMSQDCREEVRKLIAHCRLPWEPEHRRRRRKQEGSE
jgi:hypothetical protein